MRIRYWSSDLCCSDLLEDAEDGMQRPHAAQGIAAPAHRRLPWQGGQRVRQDRFQHVGGGGALLFDHGEPELALAGIALLAKVERGEPRSEEHTSELQSLMRISYAVFCLKKKKHNTQSKKNTRKN